LAVHRGTRIPLKTIRGFIHDHRIDFRLKNVKLNPKSPKYLVNVDEVARVATVPSRPAAQRCAEMDSTRAVGPSRQNAQEWIRSRIVPQPAR
jgi:hypothetical protein